MWFSMQAQVWLVGRMELQLTAVKRCRAVEKNGQSWKGPGLSQGTA